MKLLSVLSTSFDASKRLVVKAWNGRSDTRTAKQYAPSGIDSNPISGMVAMYSRTELDGAEAIIGYLNINGMAKAGEIRFFSMDGNGAQQGYMWIKADGTLELNGNSDNAVRYSPLSSALSSEANAINIELGKIAAVLNSIIPMSYTPLPISINISSAKITNVKTP